MDDTRLDTSSNASVVQNRLDDDETIDDGSDSDQTMTFSTAKSKHSNNVAKRPVAGPSANRNKP